LIPGYLAAAQRFDELPCEWMHSLADETYRGLCDGSCLGRLIAHSIIMAQY
jgi:hypothetical protein